MQHAPLNRLSGTGQPNVSVKLQIKAHISRVFMSNFEGDKMHTETFSSWDCETKPDAYFFFSRFCLFLDTFVVTSLCANDTERLRACYVIGNEGDTTKAVVSR